MTSPALMVFQLVAALLCAASAFGVLLTTMTVRGKLPISNSESPLFDVATTDRTYQLASILASLGAMASFAHSWGAFASFLGVAVSFQIAEHFMLPRMWEAARAGQPLPMRGTRSRLELLQAMCLALIFFKLGMPPLITLASVYGM